MSARPEWERWHKSLKHDEVKSIGDAVEQLMYEAIEFGGDMGPNGNTYNGIDEGDVLTSGYINARVERFENMLGPGTCRDLGGTGANDEQVFNCSECGCVLSLYDRDGSNNLCTSFVFDYPRYCPECGRMVV